MFYAVCVRLYRTTHTQVRSEGSPKRAPGTRTHLSGRAQPRSPRSQAPPARGSSGVRRGRALRTPRTPEGPGARGEKPQPRSPAPSALPAAIFPAALCRRGAGISRRFAARRPTAAPPAWGERRRGRDGGGGDGSGQGAARLAQLVLQPLQRHQRRRPLLRLRRQAPHLPAGRQQPRRARLLRYRGEAGGFAAPPHTPPRLTGWGGLGRGEGGLGRLGVLTGLASVPLQGSCWGTRTGWPPSPSAGTPRTAASAPAAPTTAACSCGTPTAWARWRSTTCTR